MLRQVKANRAELQELAERNQARLEELIEDNTEMAGQLREIAIIGAMCIVRIYNLKILL